RPKTPKPVPQKIATLFFGVHGFVDLTVGVVYNLPFVNAILSFGGLSMSVVWRPPRKLLPFLVLFLCMVSALVVVAQQEVIPAAAPVQSAVDETGMTEITDEVVQGQPVDPVGEQQPVNQVAEPAVAPVAAETAADPAAGAEPATQMSEPATAEVQTAPVAETSVTEPAVAPGNEVPAAATVAEPAATANSAAEPAIAASEGTMPAAAVSEPASTTETAPVAVAVAEPAADKPAVPEDMYYFEMKRANVLVIIITLMAFVAYYTFHAQRGKELFIRRISGLSALEDAVGRATEMGRGVLYIPGIMDMDDIQTIAGVTILGHVAKKTAEYDTPLYAPMTRSFVMSVAQEVVKQAYLEMGRPDAFRPDRINYLTDDQFGYVAGVGGIMMREKPAACFYLGTFYAESLILAETGNAVGAIQIAGTAEPSQIPFFVAACDYTLIGEELFAASAYLSKNPREVGSLKGQDMIKLIIIALMIIGTLLVTISKTEFAAGTVFVSLAENFMRLLN
ncbi:MAG TPA: hypothetical protein PKM56_09440, partial [Candidatus Rifleibacterium sp.]|nr:hypothetical protein [Candidatus Rifleibacterium sp.]